MADKPKLKDAFGTSLEVGDSVAFIGRQQRAGTVAGFTAKQIRVQIGSDPADTLHRAPRFVVKRDVASAAIGERRAAAGLEGVGQMKAKFTALLDSFFSWLMPPGGWTTPAAIALCKRVEQVCVPFGVHVALTGGLLYKDGPRKDCDLMLYSVRQQEPNWPGLWTALAEIGLSVHANYGFVIKARYDGMPVDILRPDFPDNGEYALELAEKHL